MFAKMLTVLLLAIATPTLADVVKYKATLNSASEVPANTSPAAGTGEFTYDTATKTLSYKVVYSGLTGPAAMAHIHGPADVGVNAPVLIPFANPQSPIEGSAILTDEQASELVAGKLYTNVHTAANKGGEIRGQLMKQ